MGDRSQTWLRLALTPGLGPKGYWLLQAILRAEKISPEEFLRFEPAKRERLWREAGGRRLARALNIPPPEQAELLRRRLSDCAVRWVGAEDPAYPRRLAQDPCDPPPPVLFWKGDLALLDSSPTVGIVGRVDPSPEGARATALLAARLAAEGWLVVSGMARGIDRAAHEGALQAAGATAAFLPQGILTAAPPAALAGPMGHGRLLLLSAWPPAAPWASSLAVRRNALIAAAADALIAAEMTLHSDGTRHTVREARRRGRQVWTFLHPRAPGAAAGARWLLQTGAQPLRIKEDGQAYADDFESLRKRLRAARQAQPAPSALQQLELEL